MKKDIKREKVENFELMCDGLTLQDAIKESNRCLLCFDAPCSKACPAGTDPGKFIRQMKFENFKGAARTIRNNNILGSVCSYICPTDKLCEKECSVSALEDPINISGLQRFASEYGRNMKLEPLEAGKREKEKVAVIGAGPAGMSCAAELAKKGYTVTIFEKEKNSGGVARWNIPQFRLDSNALDYDTKNLLDLGVEIKYGSGIISDNGALDLLKDGFDAVFISTGLNESIVLPVLRGYKNSIDYITFLTKAGSDRGKLNVAGKNVAVIGGGSVAIDVAVTAAALGAKKVYIICLEGLKDLPADEEEVSLGRKMNIVFMAAHRVTDVVANGENLKGLKGCEVEMVEPGNFSPENFRNVDGTGFEIRADLVVQAIGTMPAKEIASIVAGLQTKGKGTIAAGDDCSTNIKGVFSGGDVTSGGATVAQAVGDGKKAAEGIDKYIASQRN